MHISNENDETLMSPGRDTRFFYGYVITFCSFLILMIMWGTQYSFGLFFKPMLKEFGLSRAALSGAYSVNIVMQATACIFTGKLSDKYGPRLVVTVGGSCLGISYLLMSQAQMVWQIYLVFGILASIGIAGSWVPLIATIARWFFTRRGMMSGLAAAGIGMGTMLLPPLAGYLIAGYGWRFSYIIIGFAILIVVIINAQFLKRDPSQVGLPALGLPVQHADSVSGYTFREALRTRQFWLLTAIYLILGLCLQTILVHIVPHATDVGVSEIKAATIIAVIGGVSIISKLVVGIAVDRLGNKPVAIMVTSLMFFSLIIIQLSNALGTLYFFAVIFAFGYGGFAVIQSPYLAELFGLKSLGAIFGFSLFILGAGAFGPFLAGRMFDATASYQPTFVLLAVLSFISILLSMCVKATPYAAQRKR